MSGAKHTPERDEVIWLHPEGGDPHAGEWFWTNCLEDHDPDDVVGAVKYLRADTIEGIDDPAAFREVFRELVEALDSLANAAALTSHFASPMILRNAQTTLAKAKEFQQ